MQFSSNRRRWRRCAECLILAGAVAASSAARADALAAVQSIRERGCNGLVPSARPFQRSAQLDHAAREWALGGAAGGLSPTVAADRSGYEARLAAGLRISGPDSPTLQFLRANCRTVSDQALHDIGVYQRGSDTWILMAAAYVRPSSAEAPASSARVLDLVNAARASGTRCGSRPFAPAPPVRLSGTLAGVAFGHASDMAEHDYFEHVDLAGHTPADRVRAAGYREKLVGENIAYGPQTADDVVRGWLESRGHCENIMDPRFAEMGVAFAVGRASKRGLYWVQVLVDPQA